MCSTTPGRDLVGSQFRKQAVGVSATVGCASVSRCRCCTRWGVSALEQHLRAARGRARHRDGDRGGTPRRGSGTPKPSHRHCGRSWRRTGRTERRRLGDRAPGPGRSSYLALGGRGLCVLGGQDGQRRALEGVAGLVGGDVGLGTVLDQNAHRRHPRLAGLGQRVVVLGRGPFQSYWEPPLLTQRNTFDLRGAS